LQSQYRSRIISVSDEMLFNATLQSFSEQGFSISMADKESGIISTDYKTGKRASTAIIGISRIKLNAIISQSNNRSRIVLTISYESGRPVDHRVGGIVNSVWQPIPVSEKKAIDLYEYYLSDIIQRL